MPQKIKQFSVDELLTRANITQAGPDIYSNLIQVTLTGNEALLDFFKVAHIPGNPDKAQATLVQRIIIPIMIARKLSEILDTVIKQELPDQAMATITEEQKNEITENPGNNK